VPDAGDGPRRRAGAACALENAPGERLRHFARFTPDEAIEVFQNLANPNVVPLR
jgi:hypothetical protein